jgi:hydrogenase expression/formation protein HypC
MCLAIPGQVVEVVDDVNRLAMVDVAGVRRTVNIGLLDIDGTGVHAGDWVLIHVGFAMTVLRVEAASGLALCVEQDGSTRTVETALLDGVAAGSTVLVHADVAIAALGPEPGK